MNLPTALDLYKKLEAENTAQNFFAQANARYILFGVNETNFPKFRENLDFGCDSLAFSYLSIACGLYENADEEMIQKDEKEAMIRKTLEKGAEFIEYSHFYEQNRRELSLYYLLIGALAYYAASQYSKAFVLMKKVNELYQTDVSILTSAFLRKDFDRVGNKINEIVEQEEQYITKNLEESDQTIDDRIQVVLYARAFRSLMNFLIKGNHEELEISKEILADLLELLAIEREPSMWWVVRLLIIIVNGFEESSLWKTILPLIPDNANQISSNFIRNLTHAEKPVIELFIVQRKALGKVLSEQGAVVSLPTSSGKTRIAEIAILKCLTDNPEAKILYLAPFRSLCYEVEDTLSKTFEKIGFTVSQLYGSGLFGQIDKVIIQNSHILVTTPEKAKIILRANDEIRNQIKLVIIDEGHLLDMQERQVRNEMFIEELKKYVRNNQGKIILLSAVLPNVKDIAEWVTQDSQAFVIESERTARQRLGLLEFSETSKKVDLEWLAGVKPYKKRRISDNESNNSFNKKFIEEVSSKKEAVAKTAFKLSESEKFSKPLLIFVAKANMVISHAEAICTYLESNNIEKHNWSGAKDEWAMFKLIADEYKTEKKGEIERILKCAEYGILVHKKEIPEELKIRIEKLIRAGKPRFIVGNKTLGQGVNLNVSTIIIAETSYAYDKNKKQLFIDKGEFWNIAGRAGRTYIDSEAKILFATQNQTEIDKALEYFNNEPKNVESGILKYIKAFSKLAKELNLSLEDLLSLISGSDLSKIKIDEEKKEKIINFFDWIDDALLSISEQFEQNPDDIDDYFRQTLAYIQAREFQGLNQDNVIAFLKARLIAIKTQTEGKNRKQFVSLGLPLASALRLDNFWETIQALANNYLQSEKRIEEKIALLKEIEEIMKQMPSHVFKNIKENGEPKFAEENITAVRTAWLKGENISNISNSSKIINQYFGYTVSWFLGAVANRFNEYREVFEDLALCCELGLPDMVSAKIYLSGIRSRIAAKELSEHLPNMDKDTLKNVCNHIKENIEYFDERVKHDITKSWLLVLKEWQI